MTGKLPDVTDANFQADVLEAETRSSSTSGLPGAGRAASSTRSSRRWRPSATGADDRQPQRRRQPADRRPLRGALDPDPDPVPGRRRGEADRRGAAEAPPRGRARAGPGLLRRRPSASSRASLIALVGAAGDRRRSAAAPAPALDDGRGRRRLLQPDRDARSRTGPRSSSSGSAATSTTWSRRRARRLDFASDTTDAAGVNFTHKFKKAGTYKIICTLHEDMKMKLKVN